MIALVDKPECRAVHDILLRIAEAYPQVSVHTMRSSIKATEEVHSSHIYYDYILLYYLYSRCIMHSK